MYSKYVKRIIDILLSLIVIVLFFWLYLIVAILVRVKLGSPVIFKQPRPGKDEKVFNLYKFRTMTDARDKDGNLLPDEDRLPEFGKKLRATSLDELPEFFNILKGDMSFVGPRPLLVKYLPLYNEEQRHRHDVRPGLTGWAQVNGRNLLSWEDRFEKDVFYVNHISFLMDLKIVFMTVAVVFRHNDINSATDATMEAFTGTKPKE
ncbi:MAG: sugar transferase [Butyrivibrio sp.]|nr:sugar transferase [Butyrivibrio sp.]